MVKSVTNRHTPIKASVQKICDEVKNKQIEYQIAVNQQRINNPRLMDKDAFKSLAGLITHQAIDFISRELDAAKKLSKELTSVKPTGESCIYGCKMPL